MARRRMLSATLGESRKYAALQTDIARVLYPLLIANTDKGGRLEADPFYITRKVCTRLPYSVDDVDAALKDMHRVGLIVLYDSVGIPALQIVAFREFNSPHWKEEESRLAPPRGYDVDGNIVGDDDPSGGEAQSNVGGKVASSMGSTKAQGSLSSTPTQSQLDSTRDDSSEDRMARAFATGQPQSAPKHRVRAELRRLAGPDFVQRHEAFMDAWSRWSGADVRRLWEASDPGKWPGETHKKRAWLLKDLLDEERVPNGGPKAPEQPHLALIRKYRGVQGVKDGKHFEVVGADINGQLLMTDVAGYLTPAQVEEARQCLPN